MSRLANIKLRLTPSTVLRLEDLQAYRAPFLHHPSPAIVMATTKGVALEQRVSAVQEHFSHASRFLAGSVIWEPEKLAILLPGAFFQTLTAQILATNVAAVFLSAVTSSSKFGIKTFSSRPHLELVDEFEVG
jgi:hypothetical protein